MEGGTSLTLDLSEGHLQLHNLELKPCVLPDELPFTFEAGLVGRATLEVPLFRILSRPVRLELQDVTIVVRTAELSMVTAGTFKLGSITAG